MEQLFRGLSAFSILLLAILLSCNDPSTIGSDLLDEDQVNVLFTDTITVNSYTTLGDLVQTYNPLISQQAGTYPFGLYKDPVFGKANASIYVQPVPERDGADFSGTTLDSVVLVLPYDSASFYGVVDQLFGIEVLEITGEIDNGEEYFSDQTFETNPSPLGQLDFVPSLDSMEVISFIGSDPDTNQVVGQLRIRLDDAFGNLLLAQDSTVYDDEDNFVEFLRGLFLKPTIETGGSIAFNFFSGAGGIFLYYKDGGNLEQFQFLFGPASVRMNNFEHNYADSPVEKFIDNTDLGDSLIFLQGLRGLNTIISLPHLTNFKDVIANNAELEIKVAPNADSDPELYTPVEQILVFYRDEEDQLVQIDDIRLADRALPNVIGGIVEDGTDGNPDFYRINISAHIQEMIDGNLGSEIILSAFPFFAVERAAGNLSYLHGRRANRVQLYGAGHPEYPIKLKLTYTQL